MYFRWHAAPQREESELLVFCLRDRKSIKLITEWRSINEANVVQISMSWTNQNYDQKHEHKTFFSLACMLIRAKEQEELEIPIKNYKFYIELKQVKSSRIIHVIHLIHLLKPAWDGQNREKRKMLWRNCWHPGIKRYWTQEARLCSLKSLTEKHRFCLLGYSVMYMGAGGRRSISIWETCIKEIQTLEKERLWSLHPHRYLDPSGYGPRKPAFGDADLRREIG